MKVKEMAKKVKLLVFLHNKYFEIKFQLSKLLPDKMFAKRLYKKKLGKKLNLDHPVLFNEKLWWLKLNNRDPLLTICSDKYLVRDYVRNCGLDHLLITMVGVYNSIDEIDWNSFGDNEVFIKCNHTSGHNIIYDKNKHFDYGKFKKDFSKSLKLNYYYLSREWNYKNINRKIVCEKVLRTKNGMLPVDYKFMCFAGEPKFLVYSEGVADESGKHSVESNRFRNIYDIDLNFLPYEINKKNNPEYILMVPDNYHEMVEYARILSKPFEYVRVDLYNVDGKIYFGELTFYDGGACSKIVTKEWEKELGDLIDINSNRIIKKRNRL